MKFEDALKALRKGKKIQRKKAWSNDCWISKRRMHECVGDVDDILAEDWEVVE